MRPRIFVARFVLIALTLMDLRAGMAIARADEKLAVLTVDNEVYTNVTVTEVTATDIYFNHSRGFGNAKLKNLSPELQAHFHFDPVQGGAAEQRQRDANALYYQKRATAARVAANRTPAPAAVAPPVTAPSSDTDDFVVPKLYARSFRGGPAPELFVQQWLTPPPDTAGKFVLIDFWATWCGPCRQSIPHLNELSAKYKDRLVVIGISDESAEKVRAMKSPAIDYAVGVDPLGKTMKTVEVTGIPHSMLIDPHGIVRFEGMPPYLTEEVLDRLLAKYGHD
jgi:cytochrome c biogenesis protein CcmG, thiol:disulfide interchange protein DsbE